MRVYVVSEAGLLHIFESVKEAKAFTLEHCGTEDYKALSDGSYMIVITGDARAKQYAKTHNTKQAYFLKRYFF